MSGVLEICINNIWNTVCSAPMHFNRFAAEVACRQMGFSGDNPQIQVTSRDEAKTRPISFKVPLCTGDEAKLSDCNVFNTSDCQDSRLVVLECRPQGNKIAAAILHVQ